MTVYVNVSPRHKERPTPYPRKRTGNNFKFPSRLNHDPFPHPLLERTSTGSPRRHNGRRDENLYGLTSLQTLPYNFGLVFWVWFFGSRGLVGGLSRGF